MLWAAIPVAFVVIVLVVLLAKTIEKYDKL